LGIEGGKNKFIQIKMKKAKQLLLTATVCLLAGSVSGQGIYEESQARVIEPKQDVFVIPLVADIQIMEDQKRQDYGPYEFEIQSLSITTYDDITSHKNRALYKAMREAEADLIVAATFNVKSDEKGKKLIINISGYPGKYINFRPIKLDKIDDYKWIESVYFPLQHQNYIDAQVKEQEKTKATK
jgi:hypothetical protein